MPLKLNVGLSRKVGQPDFGSLGASCNVEVELDPSLLRDDLDTFHQRVRDTYAACAQAVSDELARHQSAGPQSVSNSRASNGNTNGNSNRNGDTPDDRSPRRATSSQVRALHAIANRQRVNLLQLVNTRFQVDRPDDLEIGEASQLIDELKRMPTAGVSR